MDEEEKKESNISDTEFIIMFFIAGLNDLADWLVIGSIPIIGDILDLATSGILGIWLFFKRGGKMGNIGAIGIATIIELIPFGDILPSYTAAVARIYFKERMS